MNVMNVVGPMRLISLGVFYVMNVMNVVGPMRLISLFHNNHVSLFHGNHVKN